MASKIDNIFAASRFVLPEQRALYLQHREDQKLVPQPVIEEDELASFQYLIRDSAREDYAVTVSWWNQVNGEIGSVCSMWGVVRWIDLNARRIKLVNDEEFQWINMDMITEVRA